MRYVGFSEFFHDASLAIVNQDGSVEFASQAERYSGLKMDHLIPPEMWSFVNKDDHVTYYEDADLRREKMGGMRTFQNNPDVARKAKRGWIDTAYPMRNSLTFDTFNEHHESHCALAFLTRPWESKEDTVMVSVDGSGELESLVIKDHNFKTIKQILWPQSLGSMYGTVTSALGFKALRDEYIVMGLASYGQVDKTLYDILHNMYYWFESEHGRNVRQIVDFEGHCIAESALSAKYVDYENKILKRIKGISEEDASATIQKFFEVEVLKVMKEARKYGSKLVYSGGCAQNVTANSKIYELFDDMHIAIAPNDAGNALGCALYSWHKATGGDNVKCTPYLGHNIDRPIDPKAVAQYLVDVKICGVANGRAEYGPRALGNRSLLADVRYDVKDTVNMIKRRHKFRPFAPAILSEYADEYFEGPMNEYMQYTAKAKHDYSSVTHVDGTARVQLVKPDCESVLRQILEEYYELTGVPMLLNTSLNIRNRPMVNTIEDAEEWERKYNVKVF
jgi:carbamoyltransferase